MFCSSLRVSMTWMRCCSSSGRGGGVREWTGECIRVVIIVINCHPINTYNHSNVPESHLYDYSVCKM